MYNIEVSHNGRTHTIPQIDESDVIGGVCRIFNYITLETITQSDGSTRYDITHDGHFRPCLTLEEAINTYNARMRMLHLWKS